MTELVPPNVNKIANHNKINKIILKHLNQDRFNEEKGEIKNLIFNKDFDFANLPISKIRFSNCLFNKANFRSTDLRNVIFENCKMEDSNFSNSEMKSVFFHETDLKNGSNFKNSYIKYSEFRSCEASSIDFRNSTLKESDFCCTNLEYCDFSECLIAKIKFNSVNLTNGKFLGTEFFNSKFIDSNMKYVDLTGSIGLINPTHFIHKYFQWDRKNNVNLIVYNIFEYPTKDFHENQIMTEEINYDRTLEYGGGFRVFNKSGIKEFLDRRWGIKNPSASGNIVQIWKCHIPVECLPGVVVPYSAENSFRTSYLVLKERIEDFTFFYK